MAQTQINRNDLFYSVSGEPARIKKQTILTGQGVLEPGTVLVPNAAAAGKLIVPGDKTTRTVGWCILLEQADTTGGDVTDVPTGISGGIDEADILLVGALSTYDDGVRQLLQQASIYVQNRTNTIRVAGEGA